jgi:hypothetical protein
MANGYANAFIGPWVGETQGYDGSPAHIWKITVSGDRVTIEARWEHEKKGGTLYGQMTKDEPAFTIGKARAELLGPQHFIICGWDTNDTRGGVGPNYDVVFSRPGLPELQAEAHWRAYHEENDR